MMAGIDMGLNVIRWGLSNYEVVEAEFGEPYVTAFTVGFDGKSDKKREYNSRQADGYADGLACRQILKEQGML